MDPAAMVDTPGKEDLDIRDASAVETAIGSAAPCVVINAAAYTTVDGCEERAQLAREVNARGAGNLAAACARHRCRLVHVSTDFVFDGAKREPYLPDDRVNPLSVYGRTKAEGEALVREALADHVIVRTSWLFAVHGTNFMRTILRLADERSALNVVDDQMGCPTYARDLARALLVVGVSNCRGTYHFCNSGECSWHGFAEEILRQAGRATPVRPLASAQLNRPAARPAYSVLDTRTLESDTGVRPRPWQEALAECLKDLIFRNETKVLAVAAAAE
jgi:dTDP-4-dehydrorhamnose reductase